MIALPATSLDAVTYLSVSRRATCTQVALSPPPPPEPAGCVPRVIMDLSFVAGADTNMQAIKEGNDKALSVSRPQH